MIYVYECTHEDCGARVELIRSVAGRDLPAICPCSQSHEALRVPYPGPVTTVWHASGATRGGMAPGWAEKINADYRRNQIKRTVEEVNDAK